jgi:predicted nucleic acid-binding protein
MSDWFADTYYFLALRNPDDRHHDAALEATKKQGKRRLVTTGWILTEVGDALSSPAPNPSYALSDLGS